MAGVVAPAVVSVMGIPWAVAVASLCLTILVICPGLIVRTLGSSLTTVAAFVGRSVAVGSCRRRITSYRRLGANDRGLEPVRRSTRGRSDWRLLHLRWAGFGSLRNRRVEVFLPGVDLGL